MRYQTPQFIEEDEKLFGPLTFRQFVYLIGGLGISFVVYKLLPFLLAILFIIPIMMTALALAFYKVNERPFIDTLEAAFYFIFSNRLYTYKKIDKPIKQTIDNLKTQIAPTVNVGVSSSKLKDLAWSLDINEKTNSKSGDNLKINI
jgi:hypothetical protein